MGLKLEVNRAALTATLKRFNLRFNIEMFKILIRKLDENQALRQEPFKYTYTPSTGVHNGPVSNTRPALQSLNWRLN